ncbi:hypothetical protein EVD33_01545 [Bacteroidales bacterium SW292]|nr:hypothetical protein [Bacteroidales bacterium SW292]
MKRNYLVLSLIVAIVALAGFFACSDSGVWRNEGRDSEELNDKKLVNDLVVFAGNHAEFMNALLDLHLNGKEEKVNDIDEEVILAEMEQNLENMFGKYNVKVLSRTESESCVNEDSLEMMKLDDDIFLDYIKRHNTEAFYSYCEQILVQGSLVLTQDEIISNPDLRLDEKIKLLVILPTLNRMNVEIGTKSDNPCLSKYYSDRNDCLKSYLKDCLGACLEGPIKGTVDVIVSSVSYFDCLDVANAAYLDCQKQTTPPVG